MKRATLRLLLATAAVLAAAAPAAAQAGEDPTPGNGKKVDHVALLRQAIGGGRWVGVWVLHREAAAAAAARLVYKRRPGNPSSTPCAADPSKVVIVQTAPAVRVAIGEMFGMVG